MTTLRNSIIKSLNKHIIEAIGMLINSYLHQLYPKIQRSEYIPISNALMSFQNWIYFELMAGENENESLE